MALDDADIKAVELDAQKALLEQVSTRYMHAHVMFTIGIYAVHNIECTVLDA